MATIADRKYAIEARKRGVSFAAIARKTGVSKTTIRRWTVPEYQARVDAQKAVWLSKPENKARLREYERRRKKGRCESCSGAMSRAFDGLCKSCRKEAQHFKRIDIQRYWNDQVLMSSEIADRMGLTRGAIESELQRMRKDGWQLDPRGGIPGAYLRHQAA